jgi:hypothetical protein
MSYFVRLGRQANRKIGECCLPAGGIRAILQRMDELSERYGVEEETPTVVDRHRLCAERAD